ncbi:MATE family efflux transporter [Pseudoflavonifractor phocaeensis]|uniref:MATE family efflux transporter n=1 Tax=Pseudoflavonifractor phocaeensis TaxID=1870988 RepID=UPI001959CCAE|nr:MATE family efflux transporter [Pseudoflavonifractor phocaeensis]MBM6937701.1 MATE family efflux transporter [Pseudoflavonifractor phocaeensis]
MEGSRSKESAPMTRGPIWQRIVFFAVPLFFGNLFQQLYNTADSLIVGKFLGDTALAAVSSSGSLILLLVGFFNGISAGGGVVVARYYGAGDRLRMGRTIHTMVAFGLAAGAALTVIGVLLAPQILILMGTPADVLPQSTAYFRIYFLGSVAFVLYNVFVGILQAVGDSRHPLLYLVVSSLVNVVLDLLFVAGFHWGVWSAALATVISQCVSALLCLIHLLRAKGPERLSLRSVGFDATVFRQVLSNGLPAGVQTSIISLANVVVQSNINAFGSAAMAGCGAYSKVEGFGFLPITCFSLALSTFISQNLGAGETERARKGAKFGVICSVVIAESIGALIWLLAPVLIGAFNESGHVISYGVAQARTVTLFYCLLAFSHCMAGILRGAGRASVPMFVMLGCWCVFRILYITAAVAVVPEIRMVFWAYPITWSLSTVIFLLYARRTPWLRGAAGTA